MDLEQLQREMFRLHRNWLFEIVSPLIKGLVRQARDEIETYVLKTGSTKQFESLTSIVRIMPSCE